MAPEDAPSLPISDVARTAIAVAARLGVVSDAPVVLAEGMSTVVHLRPSPIVGRVTRLSHLVRPVDGVVGMVALARALAGRVVPPSDRIDPGPHVADGRYVTFWAYADVVPATPAEAGSSLRAFHDEARRYSGTLRSFDPRPDALRIAELVGGPAGAVLQAAATSIPVPRLTEQPVHGDAHVGNAVAGGRWLDLDEACLGPPEWDLACLQHRRLVFGEHVQETCDALAAYGGHDEQAVAALDPLVVLFTAAWGAMATLVGQPIGPRTQHRLRWLRERYAR